jgi:hypothetical protein
VQLKLSRVLAWPAALAAMVLLSSCATVQYQPPAGAAVARLTFVNDSGTTMSNFIYTEAERCTHRTMVNRDKIMQPGDRVTITIPADRIVALSMFQGGNNPSAYCEVSIDFAPQPGHSYVFTGHPRGDRCHYGLVETKDGSAPTGPLGNAQVTRVAFRDRVYTTAWDERGPWCVPLS